MDTRSLSISYFLTANESYSVDVSPDSTTNVALLYYENPNGNVSALLHRYFNGSNEWVDITSQESKGLPHEFRNAPGFNYSTDSNTTNDFILSHTLYDADPTVVYSTPFVSAANLFGKSAGALLYSPLFNATSPLAGGSFFNIGYDIDLGGSGNFSVLGMHCASSCTERNFLK